MNERRSSIIEVDLDREYKMITISWRVSHREKRENRKRSTKKESKGEREREVGVWSKGG